MKKNYKYAPTKEIARAMENYGVSFTVGGHDGLEELVVPFTIDYGSKELIMKFVSKNDSSDVYAVVPKVIPHVPAEKRLQILETVNRLNNRVRFVKFVLSPEYAVHMECDFLRESSPSAVGAMAYELYMRAKNLLENEYAELRNCLIEEPDDEDDDEDEDVAFDERPDFRKLMAKIDKKIAELEFEEKMEELESPLEALAQLYLEKQKQKRLVEELVELDLD